MLTLLLAAFNICVECSERWTTETTTAFFEVAAHLGSLAEAAGTKVETTRLWTCKVAVIAGKYAIAQDLADQDTVRYQTDSFLPATDTTSTAGRLRKLAERGRRLPRRLYRCAGWKCHS